ncbi:MAG: class I SAM-dependent RNA methyltransferase [Thermodesulfovibrionales bacterium]
MIGEQEKKRTEVESPLSLRVETPVYGGYTIGRDGKVIFIKGAIPGEYVEITIKETRKDYSIGEVTRVLEPSEFRRIPPCPYFGLCGGCQLQYIQYERQVTIKEEILKDSLQRIGKIQIENLTSITGNEFSYRHRVQFKVSHDGKLGFFKEGTREVVPIDRCLIVIEPINELLLKLKEIDLRGAKELHVISGDTLSILIKGSITDDIVQAIAESGVSGIAFDNGDSVGKDYITLDLEGLKYTVTPWGFFQGHWSLNKRVVSLILERLSPIENKRVLDLYSGAGNFSLPLSKQASEVVAIEENPYAIEDGRRNIIINGIKNCLFIQSPVDDIFKDRKKARLFEGRRYDITILDPPRPGLSTEFCKGLMDLGSERIVYVSCNPSTLARDIKKMKDKYDIESVYMIDFFPNTYHIEAVAFLRLR